MNNKNEIRIKQILNGPIYKTLLKISLPLMTAFFANMMYQVVDMIFVAQLGKEYIAAMTLNLVPMHFAFAIFIGPSIGIASLIARNIGAENIGKANETAGHGITIWIFLTLFITFFALFWGKPLLRFLGGQGEALNLAWEYLKIQAIFVFFSSMRIIFAGVLRGEGDSAKVMHILLFSAVSNIILDPIFIFGFGPVPKMGIRGASIATVIANGLAALLVLITLKKNKNLVKIDFSKIYFKLKYFLEIYRVGFSVTLQHFSMVVAMGFITGLVSTYGDTAIAAFGIGARLEMFVIIPMLGMGAGLLTVSGQNYGAKNFSRVKKFTYACIKLNALTGFIIGLLLFIFAIPIVKLFNNSPDLIAKAKIFIRIYAVLYWIVGIGVSISHLFQGLGKGTISLILTVTRVGLIGVPLAYILSSCIGLTGIWYGLGASGIISALFGLGFLFYHFKYKIRN